MPDHNGNIVAVFFKSLNANRLAISSSNSLHALGGEADDHVETLGEGYNEIERKVATNFSGAYNALNNRCEHSTRRHAYDMLR